MVGYYYLARGLINHPNSRSRGGGGGGASRINIIITNTNVDVVFVVVVSKVCLGEGHAQAAPTKEQHINIFKTNAGHLIINEHRARSVCVGCCCHIISAAAFDPMKFGGGEGQSEDNGGGG